MASRIDQKVLDELQTISSAVDTQQRTLKALIQNRDEMYVQMESVKNDLQVKVIPPERAQMGSCPRTED